MKNFYQKIYENEKGVFTTNTIFCEKTDMPFGFKAFKENMETTVRYYKEDKHNIKFEVGKKIEVLPCVLAPERAGSGFHFCAELFEVLQHRPLKGVLIHKNKLVKFRYFYCQTGDVCVKNKTTLPLWKSTSIVTNAITPLFEIKFDNFNGDISNPDEINRFAEEQVHKYWETINNNI